MYFLLFEADYSAETVQKITRRISEKLSEAIPVSSKKNIYLGKIRFNYPVELTDEQLITTRDVLDEILKDEYFDDLVYDKDDPQIHDHRIGIYDTDTFELHCFEFDTFKDELIHVDTKKLRIPTSYLS